MDFRLERLGPVLAYLDHPELAFPSVHVAGTNGKGSTAAMLHSIYTRAGYKTGLYTSPHLLSFCERIRVAGPISEPDVVRWVRIVRDAMEASGVDLTFFEITTIAAFLEFRARAVDLAIVETGLGGRLDATNVVRTVAAVITSIGIDHERILGATLADIAREKAGILRSDVPLVTGELPDEALAVIAARVAETGSRWLCYGKDFGPLQSVGRPYAGEGLVGAHQRRNAGVAAAVVSVLSETFPVPEHEVRLGIVVTRWPGRLELFERRPRILVDAAHNPQAVSSLLAALESLALTGPRVLVFGVMADKAWREMLCRLVPAFEHIVLVPVEHARSLDPGAARPLVEGLRPCVVASSAAEGLRVAENLASPTGTAVITGSIFLIAEIYRSCGGADDPFANTL